MAMKFFKFRPERGESLQAAARAQPLPLIDLRHRTVVSWSAKSACTHVLLWDLAREGLLDEARKHHRWPHRYRVDLYYHRPEYRRALERLVSESAAGWTYVKVVRDPVTRCVASYRHALKHGYENSEMTRVLGCAIDNVEGFSYATFLDYLERIDLRHCNIHHKLQSHALDRAPFSRKYLINIDRQSLESALGAIDREQGISLNVEDEALETALEEAATRHAPLDAGSGDDQALWQRPLSQADTSHWPKSALQRCEPAVSKVRDLYSSDYAMLSQLSGLQGP